MLPPPPLGNFMGSDCYLFSFLKIAFSFPRNALEGTVRCSVRFNFKKYFFLMLKQCQTEALVFSYFSLKGWVRFYFTSQLKNLFLTKRVHFQHSCAYLGQGRHSYKKCFFSGRTTKVCRTPHPSDLSGSKPLFFISCKWSKIDKQYLNKISVKFEFENIIVSDT